MDLYKIVDDYLVNHKEKWIAQALELYPIAEYGFHEKKTGAIVEQKFNELGIGPVDSCAVTAKIAKLEGKAHKFNVGFLAEMDAVSSPNHPLANEQGLAHACGHFAQTNALLAVAEAFAETGVMKELSGDLTLIGCPAEEAVPLPVLQPLLDSGELKTFCGKHELIRLGKFDDIDLMLGTHALVNYPGIPDKVMVNSSCHGLKAVSFHFFGKSAHALVCPEAGKDALNPAIQVINAINAMRKGFDPKDEIRINCCIPQGGTDVGTVTDKAVLDVIIATKYSPVLNDLYEKIIRIAEAAAEISGCRLETKPSNNYAPYKVDPNLLSMIKENASVITGEETRTRPHNYFSNDLGDVSEIMPTAQVVFGGYLGDLHSAEFHTTDEENAYVTPARVMARVILDLLNDDCRKGLAIKEAFQKNQLR